MPFQHEVILPLPGRIASARHARSTVTVGAIGVLRSLGLFDRYAAGLAPAHRELILGAVAGMWLPMDVALGHYAACDALGLSPEQQLANGRANFDKIGGTLLGTTLRMAKETGVTPWVVFPHFQRFWDRAYDGGGVSVTKVGPKEVRLRVQQIALLESPYFRNALRGLVTAVVELFATKAYVVERGAHEAHVVTFRAQWA